MRSFEAIPGTNKPEPPPEHEPMSQRTLLSLVVLAVVVGWTFLYNVLIKDMSIYTAFVKIVDTLSDDFFMGAALTLSAGLAILAVFTATKLSTQIISNVYSFRILEDLFLRTALQGKWKDFFRGLMRFDDLPQPETIYPDRPSFMLVAFSLIFLMSWMYVILFSEALFFVSWSAGVDLPITEKTLLLLPTLSVAIPFSARMMAYARYPYAQDYADFMPAAFFVVGMVAFLGYIHASDDQQFYLWRVYSNPQFRMQFVSNGLFLAFVPVFTEAVYWLLAVSRMNRQSR